MHQSCHHPLLPLLSLSYKKRWIHLLTHQMLDITGTRCRRNIWRASSTLWWHWNVWLYSSAKCLPSGDGMSRSKSTAEFRLFFQWTHIINLMSALSPRISSTIHSMICYHIHLLHKLISGVDGGWECRRTNLARWGWSHASLLDRFSMVLIWRIFVSWIFWASVWVHSTHVNETLSYSLTTFFTDRQ